MPKQTGCIQNGIPAVRLHDNLSVALGEDGSNHAGKLNRSRRVESKEEASALDGDNGSVLTCRRLDGQNLAERPVVFEKCGTTVVCSDDDITATNAGWGLDNDLASGGAPDAGNDTRKGHR